VAQPQMVSAWGLSYGESHGATAGRHLISRSKLQLSCAGMPALNHKKSFLHGQSRFCLAHTL
jgi:hypothetical protein